jgi:hypothetical protein
MLGDLGISAWAPNSKSWLGRKHGPSSLPRGIYFVLTARGSLYLLDIYARNAVVGIPRAGDENAHRDIWARQTNRRAGCAAGFGGSRFARIARAGVAYFRCLGIDAPLLPELDQTEFEVPGVSTGDLGEAKGLRPSRPDIVMFLRSALARHRYEIFAVFVTAAIDLSWNYRAGLHFTGFVRPAVTVGLMLLLFFFYSALRPRAKIAEWAIYAALWITFTVLGAIQTYLAASVARPLMDALFVRYDSQFGFDWVAWVEFVRSHSILNMLLHVAYGSLMPQIIASIILFPLVGATGRNRELLLTAILALSLTAELSALMPALGPLVHFGYGALDRSETAYVAQVLSLRQDAAPTFSLRHMEGIVSFPSFHTVLALLFIYTHRGIRWSFPVFALLNGLMLISIPSEGGHYLSDMVGGTAVAILSIAAVRAAIKPR